MEKLNISHFLVEVHLRTRKLLPPEVDPIGVILDRIKLNPNTLESRTLRRATLAVIANTGDMSESELWALSQDGLVLVNAFAEARKMGRYHQQDLDNTAAKLWKPSLYDMIR